MLPISLGGFRWFSLCLMNSIAALGTANSEAPRSPVDCVCRTGKNEEESEEGRKQRRNTGQF